MDIIKAVQLYLDKIVAECGPGMKVLLMDKETVSQNNDQSLKYVTPSFFFSDQYNFDGVQSVGDDAKGCLSL